MLKFFEKLYFGFQYLAWKSRYLSYKKRYDISKSFKFNGVGIAMYGDGEIKIGDNTYIGEYSSLQAYKDCKITIGNNCSISHYVRIYTYNMNPKDIINSKKEIMKNLGDVEIGDNCWIGLGVFIKEGVKIGNNVVIGANSVVTKDIPNNSIYAGNRVITTIE